MWSGSDMTGTSRTIFRPGDLVGTMNIDDPLNGCASGSVTAMVIRKSAREPFEVNHLWPSITHSSPSRRARVRISLGSEPATSGSVIENALRISPARSGSIHFFFCSLVPPTAISSALPGVGRVVAEDRAARVRVWPRISCMSPSFT